ncbi:hypothetical protein ViNHUV68_01490 [Vibrio sp. NH-UV-68]
MLFAVVGAEALALPYILSEQSYVQFEFIKSTTFLFQFLLLGSCSGYLTISVSEGDNSIKSTNFLVLSTIYIILVAMLLFIFYEYYWSLLAIIAMSALVIETLFKSKEKYFLAMAFKPIFSIISMVVIVSLSSWDVRSVFLFSITLSILTYSVIFSIKEKFFTGLRRLNLEFRAFLDCFSRGIPINLSALLLYLQFYLDRTFIIENYESSAASYSLAFSISQIVFVAINMFSYVNIVDFGKCLKFHPERLHKLLADKLKSCFLFYALISLASLIVIGLFVEDFYGFSDLFKFSLVIIAVGGLVNVLISVSSLHTYLKTQRYNLIGLTFFILCSCLLNQFVFLEGEGTPLQLLLKSYFLLLCYSIVSIFIVIYKSAR